MHVAELHDTAIRRVRSIGSTGIRACARDRFFGSGQGLADGATHALEYTPYSGRLRGHVLVYGLEVRLGHRGFQHSGSVSVSLGTVPGRRKNVSILDHSVPQYFTYTTYTTRHLPKTTQGL